MRPCDFYVLKQNAFSVVTFTGKNDTLLSILAATTPIVCGKNVCSFRVDITGQKTVVLALDAYSCVFSKAKHPYREHFQFFVAIEVDGEEVTVSEKEFWNPLPGRNGSVSNDNVVALIDGVYYGSKKQKDLFLGELRDKPYRHVPDANMLLCYLAIANKVEAEAVVAAAEKVEAECRIAKTPATD
ncbi:MAG: hypothetical protein WC310_01535 [Patescibacteria group bacterium]|jgi:hypothetical protein